MFLMETFKISIEYSDYLNLDIDYYQPPVRNI